MLYMPRKFQFFWVIFASLLLWGCTTITISSQPQSQTVVAGQSFTLSVVATSSAVAADPSLKLTYQWYENGKAIVGAVQSTFTMTAQATDNQAQFYVVVSDSISSLQSKSALLTVNANSVASLLAGSYGGVGNVDGQGSTARMILPVATAVDALGNVLVADALDSTVRKITPQGVVTTLAGQHGVEGGVDGPVATATLYAPMAITLDHAGNVYIGDGYGAIRKISASGVVSTLAGQDTGAGTLVDGVGSAARFCTPTGLALSPTGDLYVAEGSCPLRKVTATGVVSTLAALPAGASAQGIVVDATGNIIVADPSQHVIRKLQPSGIWQVYAGISGQTGAADGSLTTALFSNPAGLALDAAGNLYVTDSATVMLPNWSIKGNATVRKISPAGQVTTLAGTAGTFGHQDGVGATASFMTPEGIAVDGSGNLYLADEYASTVRKVSSATGVVSTLAGLAANLGFADGVGSAASFNFIFGGYLTATPSGSLITAEFVNQTVRSIAVNGQVYTLAGVGGQAGYVDGAASTSQFSLPSGVAVDSLGNIFVADGGGSMVREVSTSGTVSTVAGAYGQWGSTDGAALTARFNDIQGLAIDATHNIYLADRGNDTIRKISAAGIVSTLAGQVGVAGSADGVGAAATFNRPTGLVVDSQGNILVLDTGNNTVRKITPTGSVTTLAGSAGHVGSADGTGIAALFKFNYAQSPFASIASADAIAIDASNNLYVGDLGNGSLRKITPSGVVTTVAGHVGMISGDAVSGNLGFVTGLAVLGGNLYASMADSAIISMPLP